MLGSTRRIDVYTKLSFLLATGVLVLAVTGAAPAALPSGASNYPWVQLPAWVNAGTATVPLPTASAPSVHRPASIPSAPVVGPTARVGSSYTWVQLPAWVNAGTETVPLPTASAPWAQPPAWIAAG
jgi:hypothetical protein